MKKSLTSGQKTIFGDYFDVLPEESNFHDWRGEPVQEHDLVLDGRGVCWSIKEFAYGKENWAIGKEQRSGSERAVELGLCFKVGEPPPSQGAGRRQYQLMFDSFCLDVCTEQVKARQNSVPRRYQS